MSLMPFFIVWAVLGAVVTSLALMRKSIASKEDDSIHLSGAADVAVTDQVTIAKRLETIDKWGKMLTIVLVATGVVLAAFYCYQLWNESMTAGVK